MSAAEFICAAPCWARHYQFSQVLDVPVSFFFADMAPELAGRPPGAGDNKIASGEESLMSRRETLELVRAGNPEEGSVLDYRHGTSRPDPEAARGPAA